MTVFILLVYIHFNLVYIYIYTHIYKYIYIYLCCFFVCISLELRFSMKILRFCDEILPNLRIR